jgi:hypothetical protein
LLSPTLSSAGDCRRDPSNDHDTNDHDTHDLIPHPVVEKHRVKDGDDLTSNQLNDGDWKMLTKTKFALAAALMLGTASAVMAADSGENNQGGSVMPGSSAGVNPVDHPNNPAVQSMKPPLAAEQGIRTEGRGSSEGVRGQNEEPRKDPRDPGPSDSRK